MDRDEIFSLSNIYYQMVLFQWELLKDNQFYTRRFKNIFKNNKYHWNKTDYLNVWTPKILEICQDKSKFLK